MQYQNSEANDETKKTLEKYGQDLTDKLGPRAERERKAGAGARKAAALTGGPARAERAGEGERARAGWA